MSASALYRPAPTLQLTRPSEDTLQLQTENCTVELEGSSATLFETRILPLLDGKTSAQSICNQVGLGSVDDLTALLSGLQNAGILLGGRGEHAFLDYADMLGLDRGGLEQRLDELRVAVVGGDRLGTAIHEELAALSVGHLTLIDPAEDDGKHALSPEALVAAAREHEYMVSTFGDAFPAIDHRVNRAVHEVGTAALFCRVGVTRSSVGPLVFPSETACFTCWRMRAAACADDFERFMGFEESAAQRTTPVAHPASKLGFLAKIVAGTAVTELLKSALALGQVTVTDALLEYEPFKDGWTRHTLLRRPDCPDCSKKKFNFQIDQVLAT
ncbi:MAG: TOMM precursor leader peptide-binding protein [Pseudomonadota bacterium]